MKTIALISAVTLGSMAAFSAETTENTAPASEATPTVAACEVTEEGIQCGENCWANVETITLLAANGDPIAQYAIAWITENGTNDTEADPAKANEMYSHALPGLEKAAREGNPTACRVLAHMYATGRGVEKDPAKAQEVMSWCDKGSGECPCDTTPQPTSTDASTPAATSTSM
jgi:TPR repeat protein